MFVTDPVEPLSNQLGQNPDQNLILWGLYKVAVSSYSSTDWPINNEWSLP